MNVPDRNGKPDSVILGYDRLEDYVDRSPFYGALVGRFANRISPGQVHPGRQGIQPGLQRHLRRRAQRGGQPPARRQRGLRQGALGREGPSARKPAAGIRWSYLSRDGEEGYPGNLKITVTYTLTEDNELAFEYRAATDKATPVNLTQHAYWNLAGAGSGTVFEQEVMFNCPFYLPVDDYLMPTGEVLSVKGTPFDFTTAKPIGRDLAKVKGGYDHCLIVKQAGSGYDLLCKCHDPKSGRRMDVWTNQPSVQFYGATSWTTTAGPGGRIYPQVRGLHPGDRVFPRCRELRALSVVHPSPRPDLPPPDHAPVLRLRGRQRGRDRQASGARLRTDLRTTSRGLKLTRRMSWVSLSMLFRRMATLSRPRSRGRTAGPGTDGGHDLGIVFLSRTISRLLIHPCRE